MSDLCTLCNFYVDEHDDPESCGQPTTKDELVESWSLPVSSWDNWPGDLLVIIPCSKGKLDRRSPAAELYTGPMFTGALRAARVLVPDDQIRVLSAKHGLLKLTDEVSPYEQRFTAERDKYHMTVFMLREQAKKLGFTGDEPVVSLCGNDYTARIRAIWQRAVFAFHGCRGIGDQRHELSAITGMGHTLGVSA